MEQKSHKHSGLRWPRAFLDFQNKKRLRSHQAERYSMNKPWRLQIKQGQLQFNPSAGRLQGTVGQPHHRPRTNDLEQSACDGGEEHLTVCLIITGASVTQSLLVHPSIVPWSRCPPAPIQLAAVEGSLPGFHFTCLLNLWWD